MSQVKKTKVFRDAITYPAGRNVLGQVEKQVLAQMLRIITSSETEVTLIGRGSSGSYIAGMLNAMSGFKFSYHHISKPGESSHRSSYFMYHDDVCYVIVDDFIGTGRTVESIFKELRENGSTTGLIHVTLVTPSSSTTPLKMLEKAAKEYNIIIDHIYH
jgi:orotate phosphoribosyltransferase-like protein